MIEGQTLGIDKKFAGRAVQGRGIVNGKSFCARLGFRQQGTGKFGACPAALEQNTQKVVSSDLEKAESISGNPVQGRKQGMTDRDLKVLPLVSLGTQQSVNRLIVAFGSNSTKAIAEETTRRRSSMFQRSLWPSVKESPRKPRAALARTSGFWMTRHRRWHRRNLPP